MSVTQSYLVVKSQGLSLSMNISNGTPEILSCIALPNLTVAVTRSFEFVPLSTPCRSGGIESEDQEYRAFPACRCPRSPR
ncbi:hypothetical protein K443DRAFT_676103 [Laccaria amethystina LaAM-08-1]|uniref:Uncharacterized protein n=1 Tax=Laccaria amethystina LaAM-08-1 TaxID=1095629 RepID=A0A0C9WWS7_9AGAR|nr:hypothetical protein K443DRAFT_676103 [Laccaria amethystina LaAM-08-1]